MQPLGRRPIGPLDNPPPHGDSKRMSKSAEILADVLIVGGGLVGGSMACALGQAGVRVVCLDREHPGTAMAAEFDGRASAVALGSKIMLEGIGLWPHVAPFAAPIMEIRVADGASPLFLHYHHREVGDSPLGWIVENRGIRRAQAARLPELPSVTFLAPARAVAVERTPAGVTARLDDGRSVWARLVVAADGRASPLRQQAGIGLTHWSYAQTGIVCTVAHELEHRGIAQEHFLPAGPFAILPLPGRRSSIVWTERAELAPAIMAQDDAGFLAELRSRFGEFLGEIAVEGPRFSYPLALQFAERYVDTRLALIGDAAHGMHPIAGQGMNMGLRDVAALAEIVVDRLRLGLDPGTPDVLEAYQRWRRFDNALMLAVTDGLNRLFSIDVGPVQLARGLGLAAVDRLPALKRFFMRHAMGLVGELPRLMRGAKI